MDRGGSVTHRVVGGFTHPGGKSQIPEPADVQWTRDGGLTGGAAHVDRNRQVHPPQQTAANGSIISITATCLLRAPVVDQQMVWPAGMQPIG